MDQAQFIRDVAPEALDCAAMVPGLYPETCIVQWADETGWGAEARWSADPANLSPGGTVARYPTRQAFIDAYASAMNGPDYLEVRTTRGIEDQLLALGRSPWATGHYHAKGQPEGETLVEIYRQWQSMITAALKLAPAPTRVAAGAWERVRQFEVANVRITVEIRSGGPGA